MSVKYLALRSSTFNSNKFKDIGPLCFVCLLGLNSLFSKFFSRYGLINNKKKMTVASVFNNDSDSDGEKSRLDGMKKKNEVGTNIP